MLYEVRLNGNKYCGPTSLSALTGHSTSYITTKIRQKFNVCRVRGMYMEWCIWYLQHAGISCTITKFPQPITLKNWHENHARKDTTYFIGLTGHFVVVRNGKIVCTQFKGIPKNIHFSKYLRKQVKSVYIISGEPTPEIAIAKRSDPNYSRAKKLIKHFNIDLEVEKMDGYTNYWIYLPENMIDEKFNGNDPWDDNHIADSWGDIVRMIEETAKEYSIPLP